MEQGGGGEQERRETQDLRQTLEIMEIIKESQFSLLKENCQKLTSVGPSSSREKNGRKGGGHNGIPLHS